MFLRRLRDIDLCDMQGYIGRQWMAFARQNTLVAAIHHTPSQRFSGHTIHYVSSCVGFFLWGYYLAGFYIDFLAWLSVFYMKQKMVSGYSYLFFYCATC